MHMADALISPVVGGTMFVVTGSLIGYCSKKVKEELNDSKIPLMGVLGAFIFAAQMINFTIPVTGSSGHMGGGMILAILLGPYAAFITLASIITVQALFFADGGLLALGCNIFNMGFFSCLIAYPLIYKPIAGNKQNQRRIFTGSIIAAVLGLQFGAFAVVLETVLSGISSLPFSKFVLLMQPIHLAIGIVEGIVTAAVIIFIWKAHPEILQNSVTSVSANNFSIKKILIGFAILAVFTGAILSWFASTHPDGLEWAIFHTTGKEALESPNKSIHKYLSEIQGKTAFLPDYNFKESKESPNANEEWPAVKVWTSVSGLIGGGLTLAITILVAFILKKRFKAEF